MTPLLWTLLALVVAPVLERLAARRPELLDGIDGFVLVGVTGIVLLHVAPEGYHATGWGALAALALGLVLASLTHHHPSLERSRTAMAVFALSIHAALDGIALGGPDSHLSRSLGQAVVLHTLPVGIGAWRLAYAHGGAPFATGVTAAMAEFTLVGYAAAGAAASHGLDTALLLAQCLAAGAVLHVVFHFAAGRVLQPFMLAGAALGLFSVVLAG